MVLQTETRAKIEAIRTALEKGDRDAIAPLIASFVAARPTLAAVPATGNGLDPSTASDPLAALAQTYRPEKIVALEDLAASLAMEEQLLLQECGLDHPRVRTIQKKQEIVKAQIADLAKGMFKIVDGKQVKKHPDFIEAYEDSLREELKWQQMEGQALDKLFQDERDAARGLSESQAQDENFRHDIANLQTLFDTVVKRLSEIDLVKDAGGVRTNVVSTAEIGKQIEPRLLTAVGMGGFLGALAAFGLGWLTEVLDKRFRAPEDVRSMLGVPILGHIPAFERKNLKVSSSTAVAAISPTLCVVHNPKGTNAEAYRALRTAIFFNAHAAGRKVIQVTSPNPGDGKTTTSANMAFSMAESGKRVLLVDADFRRPRIHKLSGLENTLGLWQVVEGEAEIGEAIHATGVAELMGHDLRADGPPTRRNC